AVNDAPAGDGPPSIPRSPSARSRPSKLPKPAQLAIGSMLQHLRRRPAGRQPAAMQLIDGQGLQPAHQPGTKIAQVAEQDLSAWRHRDPGIREGSAAVTRVLAGWTWPGRAP